MGFTCCLGTLLSIITSRRAIAELTPLKLAIMNKTSGLGHADLTEDFSGSRKDQEAMVTTKGKVTAAV